MNKPPSPATETAPIEAAIAAGDYGLAARLAEEAGDLLRAQALLEKVWDFARAQAIATRRGDRVASLRLAIEGRDVARAAEVTAAILDGGTPEELAQAAEVSERKRLWREAGRFRERAGEAALARALYERAGMLLDAGRLDEQLGRFREAGMAYERLLRESAAPRMTETDPAANARALAEAQLALGRVLGILGRHEEATRHLQAALATTTGGQISDSEFNDRRRGREQLVGSLAALGMRDAAAHVLANLQSEGVVERPSDGSATDDREALETFLVRRARETGGDLLAGRYEVIRLLGSGGMGRVYLARDRVTDEEVAVKVVAPPVDPRAREGYRRFLREARVVSALFHPHIVAVREVREDEGLLVMEFMAGGTLEARIASLPVALTRALLLQIVRGLEAAHARGVIHRDVKPANVFLTRTGEAKLGDFGVAHLADLGATQTAGFIGTLAYMSPEQVTGAPLTFACDVYALGITAFQMLTGRLPFEGPDFVSDHLARVPPAPSSLRRTLRGFDAVIARMLEKDPVRRHTTLEELARDLEAIAIDDDPGASSIEGAAEAAIASDTPATVGEARYRIEADLAPTAFSTLHRAVDERLGRPVIVERFAAGAFAGHEGAKRRSWLGAMARSGGPHLQRVLRLDRVDGEGGTTAVYEAVVGTPASGLSPDPLLASRLALDVVRALSAAHREGAAHGDVASAIVVEPGGGATLTIAGRSAHPHPNATPEDDLAALAALLRRLGGSAVPDGDATAMARWARDRRRSS